MKWYQVMVFNRWENATSFERVTAFDEEEARRLVQSSNRGADVTVIGEVK